MKLYHGWAGLAAVLLSTFTIAGMAALRTDGYDHLHKAVSELGSTDAPNRWVFNVLGYIVPGLLIALLANGFWRAWERSLFSTTLALSGLFMTLAGLFPVDMEHRRAFISVVHSVGSLGSGLAWLLCSFSVGRALRPRPEWRRLTPALQLLPVLAGVAMVLTPANMPALAQRFSFGGYFLFVALLSLNILRLKTPADVPAKSSHH